MTVLLSVAVLAGVLVGWLRGGKVDRLLDMSVRWATLPVIGFGIQVAILRNAFGNNEYWVAGAFILSLICILLAILRNHRTAGFTSIGVGVLANLVVITANRGKMPVFAGPEIVSSGGSQALTHAAVGAATNLVYLADVIRVPTVGGHFYLLSVGDMLIAVGVFLMVHRAMTRASLPLNSAEPTG